MTPVVITAIDRTMLKVRAGTSNRMKALMARAISRLWEQMNQEGMEMSKQQKKNSNTWMEMMKIKQDN